MATQCPAGQHFDGTSCVPNTPVPGPTPPVPVTTPPVPKPTTPSGPGPVDHNNLPSCGPGTHRQWDPVGKVWRCDPDEVSAKPPQKPVELDKPSQECGPGMHWNNNAKQCRPGPGPTGVAATGAGGGGGGGGNFGISAGTGADPFANDDAVVKGWIDKLLGGELSLFGPDYMAGQEAQLFQATQGRLRQSNDEINRDLIKRGLGRSGVATDLVAGATRTSQSDYSKGMRDILIEKQRSDLELKLKGLDAMQRWLDSRRQYILQKESNALQREIGLANIRLGYARIDAEKEMLTQQLSHQGGGGGGGGPDWQTILGMLPGLFPPPVQ